MEELLVSDFIELKDIEKVNSRLYWDASVFETKKFFESQRTDNYITVQNDSQFIGLVYTKGNPGPGIPYTGPLKFIKNPKKSDYILEFKWISYNPTTNTKYFGVFYETYVKKGNFVECKTYVVK